MNPTAHAQPPPLDQLVRSLNAVLESFGQSPAVELLALRSVAEKRLAEAPAAARGDAELNAQFEAARIDALGADAELRKAQGGGLTGAQFARKLGLGSPETVRSYRLSGKIFAWEKDARNYRYPAWQIHRGQLLHGLTEVLAILREKNLPALSLISFFLHPSEELEGKSPLELMRARQLSTVIDYAKRHGDIGS